jgi:hypothetical protein
MRSHSVALGVTAVLAVGILAVAFDDGRDYDYAGVCVDERTNVRVDDAQCRSGPSLPYYGWYFIHTGRTFPRVGVPVLGGSFTRPAAGSVHLGGVSTNGGVVTRGGFGHGRLSGGFHGG